MKILVTAGPTREHIDSVRFITNASSGRMGVAVAAAAAAAGHDVTLLLGPVEAELPKNVNIVRFVTFDDLRTAAGQYFPACDVLVMAAAVGDFTVENRAKTKISRRNGPVELKLVPTPDILGELGSHKSSNQKIIAFAVEDGQPAEIEAKAHREMALKNADVCVLNTPAAMSAAASMACILSPTGVAAQWAMRDKTELAKEIVKLF